MWDYYDSRERLSRRVYTASVAMVAHLWQLRVGRRPVLQIFVPHSESRGVESALVSSEGASAGPQQQSVAAQHLRAHAQSGYLRSQFS